MGSPLRRLSERLSGTPRLIIAVVLLAAGTLVALTATTPPRLGPVLVAARAVRAGAVLSAADLRVERRAADELPDSALTQAAPALGQRVVAALARGEVLTRLRLAPAGFAEGLAAGRAVATATVAAGRAAVVTAGDTVRLVVSAGSDSALDDTVPRSVPETVTSDARVLAVWPGAEGADAATLVVDVDVGSASRLAVLPVDLLVGVVVVTA